MGITGDRLFHGLRKKYWYIAVGVVLIAVVLAFAAVHMMAKLPPLTTIFPNDNNRFTISSGAKTGPMLQEGYLIPFDPVPGDTQTMSIIASDSQTITAVTVTIVMDKTTVMHQLKLTEGDATHGLWKGSWEVSDTHDTVYNIIIAATDKTSSSSVQITLP